MSSLFIAADVGNARIKLGLFEREKGDSPHLPERPGGCHAQNAQKDAQKGTVPFFLPEPLRTLSLAEEKGDCPLFPFDQIESWLDDASGEVFAWWIASVNRPAATKLIEWLREHRPADRVTLLAADDLPLTVRLPRPDMVGIDRLVDAVAVNRLRRPTNAAAIVDVGSAITVDLVSADGVFLGGAILPGIGMSARALQHFTDLLPLVDMSDLGAPPPPVGIDTESAIQSGLYWGAIGAVRQLVEQLHKAATGGRAEPSWGGSSTATPTDDGSSTATPTDDGSSTATPTDTAVTTTDTAVTTPDTAAAPTDTADHGDSPQVFLTGGAGAAVAELLGPDACFVPNLTLSGIAMAAMRLQK